MRAGRGGDRGGDRTAVERVRSGLGDQRQGLCQIGLDQPVAGAVGASVRPQEKPRRLGILGETPGLCRDGRGIGRTEHKAVAGERDRRRHHRGAAEPAIFGEGMVEAHHRARHPGGAIAVEARLAHHRAGCIEEHAGVRSARCGFAEIDDAVLAIGAVDQHEPAAADIAAARVDHGQRIADRDGRVDRIAAGGENAQPDRAGLMLGGDDHAALALGLAMTAPPHRGLLRARRKRSVKPAGSLPKSLARRQVFPFQTFLFLGGALGI